MNQKLIPSQHETILRAEMASVVRSFIPPNHDGDETEQAIAYALELAARAVERGTR